MTRQSLPTLCDEYRFTLFSEGCSFALDLVCINRLLVLNETFLFLFLRAGAPEPLQSRDIRTLADWTSGILGLVSSNQFERCSLYSLGAVSHKLVIVNKTECNWQRGFLESLFLYLRWSRNLLITNNTIIMI